MSFEADFLSMTADSVTVHAPATSMTAYGSVAPATTSTGKSYRAALDMTPRRVISQRGVEEIAGGVLFIMSSSADIGLHHTVELSDGRKPEILRVEPLRDEHGQHHVEVYLR